VDGTPVTSGQQNGFDAGTYTASETQQDGYTASVWGGDCAADGTVTLALGDVKSCTITNDDQPASLTIVKTVDGNPPDTDWEFTGTTPMGAFYLDKAGGSTQFVLDAGTYSVAETTKFLWEVSVTCTSGESGEDSVTVVLDPGEDVTCTFVNTRRWWAFTPGFWKNHGPDAPSGNDAWQYTAYYPPEEYVLGLVFTNAELILDDALVDMNLLDALSALKGGRGLEGAGEILLRAGIASLLNASFHEEGGHDIGLDGVFPYTSAEVIQMVNDAIVASLGDPQDPNDDDRQPMLDLAYELDQINNGIDYINWDDPYSLP
jgi:hypothetical protein